MVASSDAAGTFAHSSAAGEYAVAWSGSASSSTRSANQAFEDDQPTHHTDEPSAGIRRPGGCDLLAARHRSGADFRRKELTNTEIQNVPIPRRRTTATRCRFERRGAGNQGRVHFDGGDTNQANYTLDGFNISDPVTGRLETRLNMETIQSWTWRTAASARTTARLFRRARPEDQDGRRPLSLRRHQLHSRA